MLSAWSVEQCVLWEVKVFRDQIGKLKILKGLKITIFSHSPIYPTDKLHWILHFWQKTENHTDTQIFLTAPHVCYLLPNFISESTSLLMYQQHASISHSLWPFPVAHTEFMQEYWDSSFLSNYTKMHMKACKNCLVPKSSSDNISLAKTLRVRIIQKKWWTNTCMSNKYQCALKKCLFSNGSISVPATLWTQGSNLDTNYIGLIASLPRSAVCSKCAFWPSEKLGNPAGL